MMRYFLVHADKHPQFRFVVLYFAHKHLKEVGFNLFICKCTVENSRYTPFDDQVDRNDSAQLSESGLVFQCPTYSSGKHKDLTASCFVQDNS